MRALNMILSLTMLAGVAARAQSVATPHALDQIRSVEQAIKPLAVPESALVAGFHSVLGWIPTMGTHWVHDGRMLLGKRFDMKAPSQLMFSPMNGKDVVVGAAYAYIAPVSDSTRPASFDGNPPWHEHRNLAPPGQTLVMLHIWFVPSPDGPFAGNNPNLPFWAVGLTPPDPARMHDPTHDARIRRTALALAEVADSAGLFPVIGKRPAAYALLAARRDSIRALIPQLDAAQRSGDWAHWDRIADQAVSHWSAMRETYIANAFTDEGRERIRQTIDDLLAPPHPNGHRH